MDRSSWLRNAHSRRPVSSPLPLRRRWESRRPNNGPATTPPIRAGSTLPIWRPHLERVAAYRQWRQIQVEAAAARQRPGWGPFLFSTDLFWSGRSRRQDSHGEDRPAHGRPGRAVPRISLSSDSGKANLSRFVYFSDLVAL